jgi:hypothetical protein
MLMLMAAFFVNGEYLDGAMPDRTVIFFGDSGRLLEWQLAAISLILLGQWQLATFPCFRSG